jgi:carboxymethylenebutenolidase
MAMCHDRCPYPIRGGAAIAEREERIPLERGSIPMFVAAPDLRPAPAVLLIHDINGPNAFYQDVARRLAGLGYLTALPDFFHRQGPPRDDTREAVRARMNEMTQSDTLADIQFVLHWLRDHEASTGKVGTIGFCMGGTLVMLAAARQPAPEATVAFYGFPHRDRTPLAPILPTDKDEVATLSSPMLAFWGDQDTGVGMDNVRAYDQLLERYDKEHEFVVYPGIGHGFLTFDPAADAFTASRDAWDRTTRFLSERLGNPANGGA